MIVISPSLTISPSATAGPNNPVILWENLVTVAGIATDEEDLDFPAVNLANPSTGLRWQGETTADQYLTFTVSSEDEIEAVGLAGHNFGTGQISVTLELWNGTTWDEVIPAFLPADDAPILMRFEPTFLTQVRLFLQPTTVIPRLAVVYVGGILILQRKIYVGHNPITLGRSTDVQQNWSEGGHFLGAVTLRVRSSTGFTQQNLDPLWVRNELKPFIEVCKTTPFFFAWRPEEYPLEVGYVVTANDPRPTNQRPNGMMQVDFQITGTAP